MIRSPTLSDFSRQALLPIPEDRSCQNLADFATQSLVTKLSKSECFTFNVNDPYGLVNNERLVRGIPPLKQSAELQMLAEHQAVSMATGLEVTHTVDTIEKLRNFLQSENVGENVQRGLSCFEMHDVAMRHHKINRSNILSGSFQEVGVGLAQLSDGTYYMCQYFRS